MTETPTERRLRDIVRTINGEPLADEKAIDKGRQAIALLNEVDGLDMFTVRVWDERRRALLTACQEDER